jgi:hypothetical protein
VLTGRMTGHMPKIENGEGERYLVTATDTKGRTALHLACAVKPGRHGLGGLVTGQWISRRSRPVRRLGPHVPNSHRRRAGIDRGRTPANGFPAGTQVDLVVGNSSMVPSLDNRTFTPQFDGMAFVILSGASGAGKTAIAEGVAARYAEQVDVHHFDTIGVPAPARMIAEWGSGEGWQRAMTYAWIGRIGTARRMGRHVLLEGQMRLDFVAEAAAAAGIKDYRLILVDCDDATRSNRLSLDRHQGNLATAAMLNWAEYLRGEAIQRRCTIFDTSILSLDDCVEWAWSQLCL